MIRWPAVTTTPRGMTKPEPTYVPLRSSLGHSIFTTALKIVFSSSGGRDGACASAGGVVDAPGEDVAKGAGGTTTGRINVGGGAFGAGGECRTTGARADFGDDDDACDPGTDISLIAGELVT